VDIGLTPWMQLKIVQLLDYAQSIGIDAAPAGPDAGRRSCERQDQILAGGAGTATTVGSCHSWHVWGRAIDLRIPGDRLSDYQKLGEEWERWGGVWGGRWTVPQDPGHFEFHPDVTDIHELCPAGAGHEYCPDPSQPWPDDRPMLQRPGVQAVLGLALAGYGIYLARRLARV
jgi:hypothetical protein